MDMLTPPLHTSDVLDEIDENDEHNDDAGQTTAEYALVLLGVAAIAAILIKWATSASGLTRLFTTIIRKLIQGVTG